MGQFVSTDMIIQWFYPFTIDALIFRLFIYLKKRYNKISEKNTHTTGSHSFAFPLLFLRCSDDVAW